MEQINLKDLFNYYKSKIIYILIILLLVVICGVVYKTVLEKPEYKTSTSLILAGFEQNELNSSIDNNELTINQKLLPTYQQITKSDKVLSQVIEELDLDYELEELANNITVSGVTDTEIIEITVTDTKAKRAYKIATKISEVFSKEVKEIYNVSNVSVLDEARIAEGKSNLSFLNSLIIFIVVGAFLGVSIISVCFYFDTTVKTSEQIEAKFDIPVLGSIPNFDNKKTKNKRGRK